MTKRKPTKEEIAQITQMIINSPHIVILGAGASRAACPNGDKNGNVIPLMNDFIDVLELDELEGIGKEINSMNFEEIYSIMCERDEYEDVKNQVEVQIYEYFEKLEIPDFPTIYDHLLLSLTRKDVIATFVNVMT